MHLYFHESEIGKNFPLSYCGIKNILIFAPANEKGAIAQLVEQRTENPCVPGSIPGGTTRKNFSLLKSSEIQQFRGDFYFCHLQKMQI